MRCHSSLAAVLVIVAIAGCAGARSDKPHGTPSVQPVDAGSVSEVAGPSEPPFAASPAEATTMIAAAVDSRATDVSACVRDFRARKSLLHERVAISFGVDQDGKLLGVTSKGKEDAELKACVQRVLTGVVFPRSRAGVITVTKTYQDRLQERPQ